MANRSEISDMLVLRISSLRGPWISGSVTEIRNTHFSIINSMNLVVIRQGHGETKGKRLQPMRIDVKIADDGEVETTRRKTE